MKKILIIVILFICMFPVTAFAQRGCCSHHGGVVGCRRDLIVWTGTDKRDTYGNYIMK